LCIENKKIGAAERESRMQAIRQELGGLQISGDNEPSYALLDRACQLREQNTVKFLEPATCASQNQEIQRGAKSKELAFEGGALVVLAKDDKTQAPTDSVMKLHQAWNCFEVCAIDDL